MYKNINGFSSLAKFKSFLETFTSSSSNPGSLVKHLGVFVKSPGSWIPSYEKRPNVPEVTKSDIGVIGKYCPKAKCFEVQAPDRNYWEGITSEVHGGRFKHLSRISVPEVVEGCLAYANTAVALSNNLKLLCTQCLNIEYNGYDSRRSKNQELNLQHSLLLDNLHNFSNLESPQN